MKIEHVAIWCKDLEALRDFYVNFFEARSNQTYINAKKGFASYVLTFESGARLELMQMGTIPDSANDAHAQFTGIIHLAISVGSENRVDQLTKQLRDAGCAIIAEPRRTGDGYYESVVLDPEDNRIEITA